MALGKPGIKSHRNSSIASAKINFLPWYWETQWGQSIQCQTLQSLLYASAWQAKEMYKTGSWLALHSIQVHVLFLQIFHRNSQNLSVFPVSYDLHIWGEKNHHHHRLTLIILDMSWCNKTTVVPGTLQQQESGVHQRKMNINCIPSECYETCLVNSSDTTY